MKIEQMLHGYDNGHRLLSGSMILKSRADMDTIATLSDWSEYVAGSGSESSYVTAYPLRESGYYVIAKTWYANEMKRPGCVWTHSLLLSFDMLNGIDDFKRISSLFVRPSGENGLDDYSHQIDYENRHYTRDDYKPLKVDRETATLVMASFLRTKNVSLIFGGIPNNHPYEELMLGAMNAIPMEMLQFVSWTTGTGYSRKLEGKSFTCQIISSSSEALKKAKVDESDPWISFVTDALMLGDVNEGQLIRMFADDIRDNACYYVAIVRVLYTLEDYMQTGKDGGDRFRDVFEIIAKSFPTKDLGRTIKKLCSSKSFSDRYCNDNTFFYHFATLSLNGVFDEEDTSINQRWEQFIETNHDEYVKLLGSICDSGSVNEWGMKVLKESVDNLTEHDLTNLIENDYHLFSTIAHLAPKILDRISWEAITHVNVEKLLPLILDERTQGGFTQWDSLFRSLLKNEVEINLQLARLVFTNVDEAPSILLTFVNKDATRFVSPVMEDPLSKKADEVLKWLAGVEKITDNVAYAIMKSVNEHSPAVVSSGSKVWEPFLKLQYHSLRAELYAYLFVLSFNWVSEPTALELMRMAFEPLYKLEFSGNLSYSSWSRIALYMEPVMIWDEWDKCKKMRKTVVKRLARAGADKSVLVHYTTDNELNEQLMSMW